MEYTVLGKTGLKISRVGFGGIPIQRVNKEQAKPLIARLAQEGVNYIDTARGYTVSEEYLGYAMEGLREKFILATKSMARTKEGMEKDISISLQNLRTEYIDLYQVHNPSAKDLEQVCAPGGALEALQEAKKAGKIGHIGITLHSVDLFREALELPWVETIMFPYNIVETQAEELIARCTEKNIGFICMKPLAGGALENAPLAIRFIMQNPNVNVVIPGMAEEKEITQNIAAALDNAPLTEEEMAEISHIRNTLGTEFCRRCNYCAPCTAGINISGSILFEGYFNRYDLKDWAYDRYMALPVHADACVDCGVCESRCPYNLPIRKMLKRVQETFANYKK
jgi:predicted aldo/keto reductase-like oxidoreductase